MLRIPRDVKRLFYLAPLNHIPLIFEEGILCHNRAHAEIEHLNDFSNEDVQDIRTGVRVGRSRKYVHEFANVYFNPRNGMMHEIQANYGVGSLGIVCVDREVLRLKGTWIATANAASSLAEFYKAEEGLKLLNFDHIYRTHARFKKAIRTKMAEVLVPDAIAPKFISGVLLPNVKAEVELENYGFEGQVEVCPRAFDTEELGWFED